MLIFFLRVTHTYNARVAQWWSTSLPRRGPRVRSPSRAFYKKESKRVLFFALNERRSCARRFEVSPAGSVVAPAKQGHPQDDRNPSRTFHKKESKRVLFLCFYRAQARDEVDAKESTSYTAQGAVFCIKRA